MINLGSFSRALMPGVNEWVGLGYNEFPEEWKDLVDVYMSDKAFEETYNSYGTGLLAVKPEGAAIQYADMEQTWRNEFRHLVYSLGYIITREAVDDNKYPELMEARSRQLGLSARQTRENVVANLYNRAFDSNYTFGDGKVLCATDHLLGKGGTYSNRPISGVDLSEASLEDALIAIEDFRDDSNRRMNFMGRSLIIPKELKFEAERILGNENRPATADRDINAMVRMGMLPDGWKVNHYLSDTDAWFIRTNCKGLKLFERDGIEVVNDTPDFDTDNMRYKVRMRFVVGADDARAIYGSPGA